VLNINCANPNGPVNVTLQPGNVTIPLADNGAGADIAAGDGIYSATWTPTAGGSYTFNFPGTAPDDADQLVADVLTINVDALLKPGFPVRTLSSTYGLVEFHGRHETVVADLGGAPGLEIVTSGWVMGPLFGWDASGALLTNFPRSITDTTRWDGAANLSAARLVSGSSYLQVVAGYNEGLRLDIGGNAFVIGSVDAFFSDAASVPGWPRNVLNRVFQTVSVADVDGDGRDELFTGDGTGSIIGFGPDGFPLPGFYVRPTGRYETSGTRVIADLDYDVADVTVAPGSSLYVFSDGIFEIVTAEGSRWSLDEFEPLLRQPTIPGVPEPERLLRAVKKAAGPRPFDDDASLMMLTFP
jgi:hypothetical protein